MTPARLGLPLVVLLFGIVALSALLPLAALLLAALSGHVGATAWALAVGGVAAGAAGAAWLAARLGGRLRGLTREVERIRRLDLDAPAQRGGGTAETNALDDAMAGMKGALRTFSVYVPRDLVRKLTAEGAEVKLGGERRRLTVMFSDVQGFTTIAEPMDPEELMHVTSAYFQALTDNLLDHHATIDKYIGDAVMALWNAPKRDLAHAMHGCRAALHARADAAAGRGVRGARLAAAAHPLRPAQRRGGGGQCRLLRPHGLHGDRLHGEHRLAARGDEQDVRHADPGLRADAARRGQCLRVPPGGPGASEGRAGPARGA
jgi:adenylate cyclase